MNMLSITIPIISEKLVLLGDSISKGIVLNETNGKYERSSSSFAEILQEKGKIQLLNLSKFGATIRKGMEQLERKRKSMPQEGIVVLEFGGNDCNFDWSQVAEDPDYNHLSMVPLPDFVPLYEQLIGKIKEIGLRPVLLNLPPLDPRAFFEQVTQGLNKENILKFLGGSVDRIYRWQEMYSNTIPTLAQKCECLFVDIRQRFLNEKHYEDYICRDGMHPNEKGQQLIADSILERLQELLGHR